MKAFKDRTVHTVGILSAAHMCVDFLCAFSLFRCFRDLPDVWLLYNYCAFALQLPLGIFLDLQIRRKGEQSGPGTVFTLMGMVLTVAGTLLSPVIAGIGNALFHCGGGVLTIAEDRYAGLKGRGLGVFVAPGAVGLVSGMLWYSTPHYRLIRNAACVFLLLCGAFLAAGRQSRPAERRTASPQALWICTVCFIVVVLRSLCGMALAFPWKNGAALTLFSVFCLACGKSTGGFLAARFGIRRTVIISLAAAALCYAFGQSLVFGLCALFFFNMSMPLTLYLAAEAVPEQPGFAFGLLTLGLFLGWLPVHYGVFRNLMPFPSGTLIALVSLVLLFMISGESEHD